MSILRVETLYSQGFEIEQGNGWSHWIDHYGRHHYSWMDPDGTWNDQNDPPVPWPPGDWPDQGDGNSGNDWHDEGDDWANDDDWWDQLWEDPWEDWSYEDDLIAIGGGVNIVACPRLESRTDKAPNRTRLILGIGEEVEVRIKNKCGATVFWEINGVGVLTSDPNDQSKVTFQAHWTPGELRITANLTGLCPDCGGPNSSVELVFQVIAPNGMFFDNNTANTTYPMNIYHLNNRVSAGYHSDSYLLPANVNFYNIRIREGHANGVINGPYFTGVPAPHLDNAYIGMTDVVHPTKGTYVGFADRIRLIHSCRDNINPELPGTISYDIPNYYENPIGPLPDVWFINTLQRGNNVGGEANSTYIISKANSLNSTRVQNPTSIWPTIPTPFDGIICH